MDIHEVALQANMNEITVRNLLRQQVMKGKHVYVGSRAVWEISRKDLDEFLAKYPQRGHNGAA